MAVDFLRPRWLGLSGVLLCAVIGRRLGPELTWGEASLGRWALLINESCLGIDVLMNRPLKYRPAPNHRSTDHGRLFPSTTTCSKALDCNEIEELVEHGY